MLAHLVLGAAWLLAPHPTLPADAGIDQPNDSVVRILDSRGLMNQDLWLVWHDRPDWAMAFYLPPATASDPLLVPPGIERQHQDLLAVPAPRLFLYAPYFRSSDKSPPTTPPPTTPPPPTTTPPPTTPPPTIQSHGAITVDELAVDSGEYLFRALLNAYFDLRLSASERRDRALRASALFADLPEAQREAIYFETLAEFGAHLLSLRNEIARTFSRQGPERHAGLCSLADRSLGLFGLWRKAFLSEEFRGLATVQPGTLTSRPRLEFSAAGLEPEDKRWCVERVFGHAWQGVPGDDFKSYCKERTQNPPD